MSAAFTSDDNQQPSMADSDVIESWPPVSSTTSRQFCRLLAWCWDVTAALEIVRNAPRAPVLVKVPTLARTYGIDTIDDPEPDTIALLAPCHLDREHAMRTDLSVPILLAPVLADDGGHMLIDGMHRLYRAWRDGAPRIPAHLLTVAESRSVMTGPGLDN